MNFGRTMIGQHLKQNSKNAKHIKLNKDHNFEYVYRTTKLLKYSIKQHSSAKVFDSPQKFLTVTYSPPTSIRLS